MITLNTQHKLNTYLLERRPGQLVDTYYRAFEEYINGPIYRTLSIALNDLFISSATPHALDGWQLFYASKPGEMSYIKWAELLILCNKITREGPTVTNIRSLLRFFDPTANIFLSQSLAILSEDSEFTIGTPVPPYDQYTEYVYLSDDSEFKLNSNDPPEFITGSRDTLLYETTIMNVSPESYRVLLKTLLRQLLPINVRVNVKFINQTEVYFYTNETENEEEFNKIYKGSNLVEWSAISVNGPVRLACSFYGTETGIFIATGSTAPYRYFKIVKDAVTEIIPNDDRVINNLPISLHSFGPDHVVITSASPPNLLTKIKVNNIKKDDLVIQRQIVLGPYSNISFTLYENYIVSRSIAIFMNSPLIITVYDKDFNLVNTYKYPTLFGKIFPINTHKMFTVSTISSPRIVNFCDFSLLPNDPVISSLTIGPGGLRGTDWNFNGIYRVDSRSFILTTKDTTTTPITYRYYNWNPYTNTFTLLYTHAPSSINLQKVEVRDTTVFLFFNEGFIVKIDNYNTTPTPTEYRVGVSTISSYKFSVLFNLPQNII